MQKESDRDTTGKPQSAFQRKKTFINDFAIFSPKLLLVLLLLIGFQLDCLIIEYIGLNSNLNQFH